MGLFLKAISIRFIILFIHIRWSSSPAMLVVGRIETKGIQKQFLLQEFLYGVVVSIRSSRRSSLLDRQSLLSNLFLF